MTTLSGGKAFKGIVIILACYFLGDILSRMIMGYIPSSVMGMIILFIALKTKVVKSSDVKSIAEFILRYMMLFFIPISVGLITSYDIVKDEILPIAVIMVVATVVVMVVVGHTKQLLDKIWKK